MNTTDAVDWHTSIAEDFAAGYDRSPRFRERLAVWRGLIARHVHGGDRVLDAGCGAGTFSFEAADRGARVEGIDGSPAMIALCRKRAAASPQADVRFDVALLETLSTRPAGSVDVVMSSSVLEYLPDLEGEVARLARLLPVGGRLLLSLPNAASRYRRIERLAFRLTRRPRYYAHVRSLATEAEMRDIFARCGLEMIETTDYAVPPGPAWLRRALGLDRGGQMLLVAVGRRGVDADATGTP
ncbi:methyltransferase domain-containing protein [Sphingomonas donggukensis]|uniref:Methyltransferase domain-containing protein n=1 Tax=Sphingomonas donggukensis TaxID=2949093 RepID=A0ABY4TVV5_9SPHN|nr:methyltransferase domain-containing protein [Sphingomonas donggukensis]URW74458.1 methyltransferase domain-containing protein [Sphingomonas donggukensis]